MSDHNGRRRPVVQGTSVRTSVRSGRLSDQVYERIQKRLLDGRIQPGERISIDALSRELGVSQTPVRESLSRLEAEDLVTKTHLIGFSASPKLTPARFEELFEARLLLEPHCAGLAAIRHQGGQVERLTQIATDMRSGYESGRDSYGAFAIKDAALHEELIAASGNDYFREFFNKLHCHLQLFRLLRDSRVTTDALDEHDVILTAVGQRDGARATAAMIAHLRASRERLRRAFLPPSSRPVDQGAGLVSAAGAEGLTLLVTSEPTLAEDTEPKSQRTHPRS